MKTHRNYLFFVYCLFLFVNSATAAEYYLSLNGADSNPGSKSQPWRTLQSSMWKMKAGDPLTVRGGIYTQSSFADIAEPSTGKISTIRAETGEEVVFDGRVSSTNAVNGAWTNVGNNRWKATIKSELKRLDGLWVDNVYCPRVDQLDKLVPGTWFFSRQANEAWIEFPETKSPSNTRLEFRLHSMIEIDTPYWVIEGISANYFNYAGITISTHHVTIRNCQAHHNGGSGIEADEATDLLIEKNQVSYNGAEGGPGWASGIHLWMTTSPHNVVRDNVSHHNWDPSSHHTDGNGFAIDGGGIKGGAEVYNNTAFKNGGRGLDVNQVGNVYFHQNHFYDNSQDPLISDQGEVSIGKSISAQGFRMENNTLKTSDKKPLVTFFGEGHDPKSYRGDFNFFCSTAPNSAFVIYINGKDKLQYGLTDWQKASSYEANSKQECK
jgi:hypothetical protein